MKLTTAEYLKGLAEVRSQMPYDGIITAVYPETVTVRPIGQTRSKSIRGVKIPDHMDYTTIKPGQACRLDKTLSTPMLTAVFSAIESKGYSGIGNIIPNPPTVSVSATRTPDNKVLYTITCTLPHDEADYISKTTIYMVKSTVFPSYNGMSVLGILPTNGSHTQEFTYISDDDAKTWFAASCSSGLNTSPTSTPVSTTIPASLDNTFQDRFSTYGAMLDESDSANKELLQFATANVADGTNWTATDNSSNALYELPVTVTHSTASPEPYIGGLMSLSSPNIPYDDAPHNFGIFMDYSLSSGVPIETLVNTYDYGIGVDSIQYNPISGRAHVGLAIEDPAVAGEWIVLVPTPLMVNSGNVLDTNGWAAVYDTSSQWNDLSSATYMRIDASGNYSTVSGTIDVSQFTSVNKLRFIIDGTIKIAPVAMPGITKVVSLASIRIRSSNTSSTSTLITNAYNRNSNAIVPARGIWKPIDAGKQTLYHAELVNDADPSDVQVTYFNTDEPSLQWVNILNESGDGEVRSGMFCVPNSDTTADVSIKQSSILAVDPSIARISMDNRISCAIIPTLFGQYAIGGLAFFVGEKSEDILNITTALTNDEPPPSPIVGGYTPRMMTSVLSYYGIYIQNINPASYQVILIKQSGLLNDGTISEEQVIATSDPIIYHAAAMASPYYIGVTLDEYADTGRISVYATQSGAAKLFSTDSLIINIRDRDMGIYNNASTAGFIMYGNVPAMFSNFVCGSPAHAEVADIAYALDGRIISGNRVVRYDNTDNMFKVSSDGGATWADVGASSSGAITWGDVLDKPLTFPPDAHNHDSIYYTETEMDALLLGKSDTTHNHNAAYLGITAKAADSDLLDGHDSTYFSVSGHTHDGRYYTETEINAWKHDAVTAGSGINVAGQQVSLNTASANTWSALQTFNAGATIANGYALQFGADVLLQRTGTNRLGLGTGDSFRSSNFQSGVKGWEITDAGDAEFSNLNVRGTIETAVFVKNRIAVQNGSLAIAKSSGRAQGINNGYPTGVASPDWKLWISNDDDVSNYSANVGDRFLIKGYWGTYYDASNFTMLDGVSAWGIITGQTSIDNAVEEYTWTLENTDAVALLIAAGHTSHTYDPYTYGMVLIKEATIVVYGDGVTNNGLIYMTADDSYSPYIDIRTFGTSPWNDQSVKVRIGVLDGITDPDLNPSGYGLYADNVFLSGNFKNESILIAYGRINFSSGYGSIRFDDGSGGLLGDITMNNQPAEVAIGYTTGGGDIDKDVASRFVSATKTGNTAILELKAIEGIGTGVDVTLSSALQSMDVQGAISVNGTTVINSSAQVFDTGNRVFSAANKPNFANISGRTIDDGTNTKLTILSDDTGESEIALYGNNQGTGRVYVGQDTNYGGGIEYNGNNSPASTGAGSDYITLYRKNAGAMRWTARNLYNNNDWTFRGAVIGQSYADFSSYVDAATGFKVNGTTVIDSNRNVLVGSPRTGLTLAPGQLIVNKQGYNASITADNWGGCGALAFSAYRTKDTGWMMNAGDWKRYPAAHGSSTAGALYYDGNSSTWRFYESQSALAQDADITWTSIVSINKGGTVNAKLGYQVNGTQVINSSGQWADDTGWITPTFASGWTDEGGAEWSCRYRRVGKIVSVVGLVRYWGSDGHWINAITGLPTPRSSMLLYQQAQAGNTRMDVRYDGALRFENATGGGFWHSVACTYIVA